ncbi:MAG: sigma-54-dependent Fis family transcriptional regulator, partial [Thermoguttaceae bacterium]|nr:sigma-54-dependent Fis family transcriptional regulator [Thermoguttaceae bacterium]
ATVLILGETGTGKELFAQALHQNSSRKKKPFVALNCAALSENLLESELFGHVKGAFTDAAGDRVGKFEYANGGTLFLDEVGDMPLATQVKLLRVLESGEITPVGSNKTVKVNVRLVSATNRNLEEAVASGAFRLDLYYRLKIVTMRLPSLRERREDVPILLEHFINIFAEKYGKGVKGVSPAARRKLLAYDWPGNVRQLRNFAEYMVVVDIDGLIDDDDLPEELVAPGAIGYAQSPVPSLLAPPSAPALPGPTTILDVEPILASSDDVALDEEPASELDRPLRAFIGTSLDKLERVFIEATLAANGGNREETARALGVGERTLYRRIKEFAAADEEKDE